jgi:hypothetical protein
MTRSYRKALEQIGITAATVSYNDFYCRPKSLAQAMDAMQLAGEFQQVSDIYLDEDWTDEVQGCATDGAHWFFTSNNPRKLYVFNAGQPLHDGNIVRSFPFVTVAVPGGDVGSVKDAHIGQFELFESKFYVSYFDAHGTYVIILDREPVDDTVHITYDRQFLLEVPTSPTNGRREPVQFLCVMPWDRTFLTCFGSGIIDVLFIHDLATGKWTGRVIRLQTPIMNDWVQGGAFSPYGHLFLTTSEPDGDTTGSLNTGDYNYIRVISPLNGRELTRIPVLAEDSGQELEGCCFQPVSFPDGRTAVLHVVLLDNEPFARDNLYFKSFQRTRLATVSTP